MSKFLLGFLLLLIHLVSADDPILDLSPHCPSSNNGHPMLQLLADVPAYGLVKCKNGEKALAASSISEHSLPGAFDQSYSGGNCLFYKKEGVNIYTVEVDIGWGDRDSEVINRKQTRTLSCVYDQHGKAFSASQTISQSILAPRESQRLLGTVSKAVFKLQLVDVLDREIRTTRIPMGRKIRLKATLVSDTVVAFRVLSCVAKNKVSSYAVVRAGCGDGLVFAKTAGFETKGGVAFSPYFHAFKLEGPESQQFQCNFTECASACDGNSCSTERRRRRALTGKDHEREIIEEYLPDEVTREERRSLYIVDSPLLLTD